jgi:hypothetical protein
MIKTGKIAHESLGNKPPSNCQTQCKVKANSRLPRQSTRVSFGVQKSLAESKLELDSNCLRYTVSNAWYFSGVRDFANVLLQGYAQERVLVLDDKGQRIVMIGSGSSRHQLRKLQQVLSLVNNHLSSPEIPLRRLLCCKVSVYEHKRFLGLFDWQTVLNSHSCSLDMPNKFWAVWLQSPSIMHIASLHPNHKIIQQYFAGKRNRLIQYETWAVN